MCVMTRGTAPAGGACPVAVVVCAIRVQDFRLDSALRIHKKISRTYPAVALGKPIRDGNAICIGETDLNGAGFEYVFRCLHIDDLLPAAV